MTRVSLVAVVAVLLTACGSAEEPKAADRVPGPAGFRYDAARLCTATANDHIDDSVADPGPDILIARLENQQPSADQLVQWSRAYDELVGRHEAMRTELAALDGGNEQEREWWSEIVASGDVDLDITRSRRDLLATLDWDRIDAGFAVRSGGDQPAAAIAGLSLEESDCVAPYAQFGLELPADSRDFVRVATTTCTDIVNRRLAAGYAADIETSLAVLADTLEPTWKGQIGPDVEPALVDLVAEWTATATDLEAVDGTGAPNPDHWAEVVAAATAKVEQYQARLDAVRTGDHIAIARAFEPSMIIVPGLDSNGLSNRSCRAVNF